MKAYYFGWLSDNMFFLLMFILIILVQLFHSLKSIKLLKKLSPVFNGKAHWLFRSYFKGEFQGNIFLIKIAYSRTASSVISILKRSSFQLRIYRRSLYPFTRFGEKTIKTNNENFDREFVIWTNNITEAVNYINDVSTMDTLRELLHGNSDYILMDGKQVSIHKLGYPSEKDLSPDSVKDRLQELCLLSKKLHT